MEAREKIIRAVVDAYFDNQTRFGEPVTQGEREAIVSNLLGQFCLMCGSSKTSAFAVFIVAPKHTEKFGGVPGMDRTVFYSLCEVCLPVQGDELALVRIEKELMRRVERLYAGNP